MKLSQATCYAIVATCQFNDMDGQVISCKELAKLGGMPERFLLQVLRKLVDHGLLESSRGVDGGYRLAKAADEISLLDIVTGAGGNSDLELPPMPELDKASRELVHEAMKNAYDDKQGRLATVMLTQIRPSKA